MNKNTAPFFFLLLSLPCASHAMWSDLVRKVPSMIRSHAVMARSMATLAERRASYEQVLKLVEQNLPGVKGGNPLAKFTIEIVSNKNTKIFLKKEISELKKTEALLESWRKMHEKK